MKVLRDGFIPIDVLSPLKTLAIENGAKLKLQVDKTRFWLIEGSKHVIIEVLKGDVWEVYRIYEDIGL